MYYSTLKLKVMFVISYNYSDICKLVSMLSFYIDQVLK